MGLDVPALGSTEDLSALPVVVDALGGDHAPSAVIEGARRARAVGLPVLLVGPAELSSQHRDLPWALAEQAVGMGDAATSVRDLPDCTLRVACRLAAEGRGGSVVSCGNTGAVLVSAMLELGAVPGIDRPALALSLPRADGGRLVLVDVGASADARPAHLATFGLLGDALARTLGVDAPRVGLLANGSERGKGRRLVRDAWDELARLPLDFVGNVEPHDALAGAVDVLVCDGFTGNIVIKTAEGIVGLAKKLAGRHVEGSGRAAIGAWLLRPALRDFAADLDWRKRGGAVLVGVRAPVVVGHGRSDARAVDAAIRLAHYAQSQALGAQLASRVQARAAAREADFERDVGGDGA